MSRIKQEGIFHRTRTTRRWLVTVDGEEFPFRTKALAVKAARATSGAGAGVRLLEETKIVQQTGMGKVRVDTFRIDMTGETI